jgi:hypothetical protein
MLRRIGTTVLQEAIRSGGLLLVVTFGMFALLSLAPGDPVSMYVNVQSLSPEEVEAVRHELGLDRSFPVRYGAWLSRIVQGDFGTSLRSGRPVAQDLWETGWRIASSHRKRHGADASLLFGDGLSLGNGTLPLKPSATRNRGRQWEEAAGRATICL